MGIAKKSRTTGRRYALVVSFLCLTLASPVWGQGGVVLLGLDTEHNAEEDKAKGHGDLASYVRIVENLFRCTDKTDVAGILVLAGPGSAPDDVTVFWEAIGREVPVPVTFRRGAEEIKEQIESATFDEFGMIAVASNSGPGAGVTGGLDQAAHDALVSRRADIARFVNEGGSLFGSLSRFASPYGYIGSVKTKADVFRALDADVTFPMEDPNKDVTLLSRQAVWDVTFTEFPSFLDVLATKKTGDGSEPPAAIGGCQVTVPSPCADVVGDEPLCATDGSGDFTYTFTVTNNTEEDIHHLFLLEPTPPVTVTPNYFDASALTGVPGKPLCSPDDPTCDVKKGENTSKPLTVTIANAAPEDVVSFLVSIHDEAVEECCSVKHTLELPACDCGQVSLENPFCSISAFPFVISQKYQFTFQNLLPDGVNNILLAPSSGSDVTVTPNHFSRLGLAGVPYSGGAGEHTATVTLTGPDAREGQEVCLKLSSHDDDYQECCSIERCFTIGSCTIFVNDFHTIGNTMVTLLESGFLRLEGFDVEGDDGVSFEVGQADEFDLGFLAFDRADVPDGASLELAAFEPVEFGGRRLASLQIQDTGHELVLRTNSISGPARALEILKGGGEVTEIPLPPGARVVLPDDAWLDAPGPEPESKIKIKIKIKITPVKIEITITFERATLVDADPGGGGDPVLGDELVFAFDPADLFSPLGTAQLLAARMEEITLTEARGTLTDCNGNGVSDPVDVADGTSADEDGDGVPDECQVVAPDLEVRLDTGFDEAEDRLVPPRGEDDDWQVVVDGSRLPARRVARVNRGWNPALPGTAWISLDGQRGASVPGIDVLRFERCFCIGNGAQGASLELELFADDSAEVFLNGGLLGGPGGRFNAPEPLSIRFDGIVGRSLFQRGENCLLVEVEDSGGVVTGLDLAGTVLAEQGACPAP